MQSEDGDLLGWLHDATILEWELPNFCRSHDLIIKVLATTDAGLPKIEGRCVRVSFLDVRLIKLELIGWTVGPEWIDRIDRSDGLVKEVPQPTSPDSLRGWTILGTHGSCCEVVCKTLNVDILGRGAEPSPGRSP